MPFLGQVIMGMKKPSAAAAGPTLGVFMGGYNAGVVAKVDRYTFSSDAVAAGTDMTAGRDNGGCAGMSTTIAHFGGRVPTTFTAVKETKLYSISGNTWSAGTDSSTATNQNVSGAGMETKALLTGGNGIGATTQEYTWSGGTWASGTNLATTRDSRPAGTSTATVAYIYAGNNGAKVDTVDKYTYSGSTVAAGTVLNGVHHNVSGGGNTTVGIVSGDDLATTNKYTYSGDVRVAGTNLSYTVGTGGGTASATKAVFGGGYSGGVSLVTSKYTFSGDSVAAGTNLGTARQNIGAASGG